MCADNQQAQGNILPWEIRQKMRFEALDPSTRKSTLVLKLKQTSLFGPNKLHFSPHEVSGLFLLFIVNYPPMLFKSFFYVVDMWHSFKFFYHTKSWKCAILQYSTVTPFALDSIENSGKLIQ